MTTPATIRLATWSDAEDMMTVCRMVNEENGVFPPEEPMVRAMLARAFDKKGGIIGIIRNDKYIEGAILLLITSFWYSSEPILEELFNWVHPDHRKSKHAESLIEYAKTCSDEIKIPLIISILTTRRLAGKVRLYRRRMGYPAGAFFVHNGPKIEHAEDDFWVNPFLEKRKKSELVKAS